MELLIDLLSQLIRLTTTWDARIPRSTLIRDVIAEEFHRVQPSALLSLGSMAEVLMNELSLQELIPDGHQPFEWLYRLPAVSVTEHTKVRRTPGVFEALVETVRRTRDSIMLARSLGEVTLGALLGGSLAWGSFYSTRGGGLESASDIDLLIFVENAASIRDALLRVCALQPVRHAECIAALSRRPDLCSDSGDGPLWMFSQKLAMWSDTPDPQYQQRFYDPRYKLSLHFIVVPDRSNPATLAQALLDERSCILDFRDTPVQTRNYVRDNVWVAFSGDIVREERQVSSNAGEYVEVLKPVVVHEERVYFGRVLNWFMPATCVVWGADNLAEFVRHVRVNITERLAEARRLRPLEYQSVWQAHPRSGEFAAHIRHLTESDVLERRIT